MGITTLRQAPDHGSILGSGNRLLCRTQLHDKTRREFTLKQSHTRKYGRLVQNSILTGVFACVLVAGQDVRPSLAHAHAAHAVAARATHGGAHLFHYKHEHVAKSDVSHLHHRVKQVGDEVAPPSHTGILSKLFSGSGIASVYGGGRTASGEHMNAGAMTAAHRTLPFGTHVTVVNIGNGRTVVVRINDRGPFVHGRIIDLSPAAARAIGVSGLARVSLRVAGGV
jgi:rare lipoprotein A